MSKKLRGKKPASQKSVAFRRTRERKQAAAKKALKKDMLLGLKVHKAKNQGDPKEVDPGFMQLQRNRRKKENKPIKA